MKIVSRLAPTPSGPLHLGNILNFQLTWTMVRQQQGQLYLRLDDTDEQRCRPEYSTEIIETLQWLGLNWDGAIIRQSERRAEYQAALEALPHYVCRCSRKDIEARGALGYDGHCRTQALTFVPGQTQIRLLSPAPSQDIVLWRKENDPAYHLASLVDDTDFGITHIVRGEDLRESTDVQLMMAQLAPGRFGSFLKIQFTHHPLIVAADGSKLSKSTASQSIKAWREQGATQEDVQRAVQSFLKT